jgi:hypothetical protein
MRHAKEDNASSSVEQGRGSLLPALVAELESLAERLRLYVSAPAESP